MYCLLDLDLSMLIGLCWRSWNGRVDLFYCEGVKSFRNSHCVRTMGAWGDSTIKPPPVPSVGRPTTFWHFFRVRGQFSACCRLFLINHNLSLVWLFTSFHPLPSSTLRKWSTVGLILYCIQFFFIFYMITIGYRFCQIFIKKLGYKLVIVQFS